jgi:hypothetical protein
LIPVPGMFLTPPAGTYLVQFSSSVYSDYKKYDICLSLGLGSVLTASLDQGLYGYYDVVTTVGNHGYSIGDVVNLSMDFSYGGFSRAYQVLDIPTLDTFTVVSTNEHHVVNGTCTKVLVCSGSLISCQSTMSYSYDSHEVAKSRSFATSSKITLNGSQTVYAYWGGEAGGLYLGQSYSVDNLTVDKQAERTLVAIRVA